MKRKFNTNAISVAVVIFATAFMMGKTLAESNDNLVDMTKVESVTVTNAGTQFNFEDGSGYWLENGTY